jgi:hypothetical protein
MKSQTRETEKSSLRHLSQDEPQPQNQATARPWQVDLRRHIVSNSGTVATCWNEQTDKQQVQGIKVEESFANAALIVRAVNEYAALCAVAEAVQIGAGAVYYLSQFISSAPTIIGRSKQEVEVNEMAIKLADALAALAAVRKEGGK